MGHKSRMVGAAIEYRPECAAHIRHWKDWVAKVDNTTAPGAITQYRFQDLHERVRDFYSSFRVLVGCRFVVIIFIFHQSSPEENTPPRPFAWLDRGHQLLYRKRQEGYERLADCRETNAEFRSRIRAPRERYSQGDLHCERLVYCTLWSVAIFVEFTCIESCHQTRESSLLACAASPVARVYCSNAHARWTEAVLK